MMDNLDVIREMQIGPAGMLGVSIVGGAVCGLIFYFLFPVLIRNIVQLSSWLEKKMKIIPTQDMIIGSGGFLVGLILGVLLSIPMSRIPWIGVYLALVVTIVMGYLGAVVSYNRKDDINNFLSGMGSRDKYGRNEDDTSQYSLPAVKSNRSRVVKVLDTSVIIDGRISDVCKTGFLEGPLIIPSFVLEELRHIADSSDLLKRNRGRRGLDILNKIQKELDIEVEIYEGDVDEAEVDSKLVKLAKELKGKVITNDYNLNKVAQLQGVPVLNINELANAVKPVVLPGEEMAVKVIKDGKEVDQGVAYLDDGTMIVVDGGKRHIGEKLEVMVTSVLQTAAGRMIFAKPKYQLDKSHA
ncbi:PIN/TRAM domain-containing protein [Natranaerofaba carboxydovora]|uniref:PIN/TRAM domain-containing protein n=1 Tax=Natranaerofaba carboxydovora TaxID=2742683 RepID=UPI003B845433